MKRRYKHKKYKKTRFGVLLILLLVFIFFMLIQYMKDNNTSISLEESGTIHSPTPTASPSPTKAPISTKLPTPPLITSNDTIESFLTKDDLYLLNANTVLTISELGDNYVDNTFYSMNLDKPLINRIYGKSYKENSTITYDDLHYVRVLHYDFTGQIRIGELIVNKDISEDLVDIFYELYEAKYPIEKMVLVDDYNGDDNTSMANNNTSAFNYREINGSNNLSKHSIGLAIDINPLYNPYVKIKNNKTTILPTQGADYIDRALPNKYYIEKGDLCYEAFTKRGFTWGGSWNSLKDYQHFEK